MKNFLIFHSQPAAVRVALLAAVVLGATGAGAQGQHGQPKIRYSLSTAQLQSVNPNQYGSADEYVNALQALDARNLESFIRFESNPPPTPYSSWQMNGPESIPGHRAVPGNIYLDFDATAPQQWYDAVHATANLPAKDLVLFEFDAPHVTASTNAADPVIEGCWVGLGGHRMAASGAPFPIILLLRGGAAPFNGSFTVSRKGVSWSLPIQLQPQQQGRFEMEPSASDMPENDLYQIGLSDTDHTYLSREFRMAGDRDQVYWITPGVAGKSTRDELMAVVNAHPTAKEAPNAAPRRLEPISPDLLPTDVRGWGPARTVVLGAAGEKAMSPEARAALLQWVAAGGHLGVLSDFPIPEGVSICVGDIGGEENWFGRGEIYRWPRDTTDLSVVGDGSVRAAHTDSHIGSEMRTQMFFLRAMSLNAGRSLDSGDDSLFRLAAAPEPVLHVPGWPVFAAVGLGYVAIFGPLSLWLMRRVKRILLVWLVVPTLASTLGLAVLVAGSSLHHTLRTLDVSAIQVVPSGSSTGMMRSDVVFFTPDPGSYTIGTGNQSLRSVDEVVTAALQTPGRDGASGRRTESVQEIDDSPSHHLVFNEMPSYSERHVRLDGPVQLDGSLNIVRQPDGTIKLVNHTRQAIPQSILVASRYGCPAPPIGPGASVVLPVPEKMGGYINTVSATRDGLNWSDYANGAGSQIRWVIPVSPWASVNFDGASGVRSCVLCVTEGIPAANTAQSPMAPRVMSTYPASSGGYSPSSGGYPAVSTGYPSTYPSSYPSGYPHS